MTKLPLAVNVVQIQEHEALWTRAWVTPGAGQCGWARRACTRSSVIGACRAGTDLWWLAQQGSVLWGRPKSTGP